MANELTSRPIAPEDEELLYCIYASTREREMALLDWEEAQKQAFLRMQFEAQHRYYQENFSQAAFDLILLEGEPVGRLYVDRREDEIRLIDIALLPRYRGRGIGSALLEEILSEGKQAGLPVRIHVERMNPAMRLYTRLGFRKIDEHGVYDLMEWSPVGAP
jgi:ribosomal protein S18 acetylase RimI-like enzyme